jgi:hypothetical protein
MSRHRRIVQAIDRRSGRESEAAAQSAEIIVVTAPTPVHMHAGGSPSTRRMLAIVKGKPVERRGRKATGLKSVHSKTAGLPTARAGSRIQRAARSARRGAPIVWFDRRPGLPGSCHVMPLETHALRDANRADRRTRVMKCGNLPLDGGSIRERCWYWCRPCWS